MKNLYSKFSKGFALAVALVITSSVAQAQNFGVDVPNPQEKLDVNGGIRIGNTTNSNAGSIRYSTVSNKFQINVAGTWYDLATTSNAIITNVSYNATTNIITIVEGSNTFTVNLTDLQDNTDSQAISYNSTTNVITLQNGGTVDLSDLQDNTDAQTLSNVYGQNGNTVTMNATAGDVRFFKVGNEIFTLKESTGNVGIGTNTPNARLQVVESGAGNALQITESGDGEGLNISEAGLGDALTVVNAGTGNAATFTGGNVGIGTTTPAQRLEVGGNARVTGLASGANGAIVRTNTSGDLSISNFPNDNDQVLDGQGNWVDINTMVNGDYIENQSTSDQNARFRISGDGVFNGGNVGIGTTSPAASLQVYEPSASPTQTNFTQTTGNSGVLITTDYTNGDYTPGVFWNTPNENPTKPKAGIYLQTNTAGSKMILATSTDYPTGITNSAVVIDQDANVGIGTSSPQYLLDVAGDVNVVSGSGYRINGTAPSGQYLRGNGTRFVSSTIPYSEITGTPTSLPPNGAAGGSLAGTYPNPTLAANSVGTAEIAANSVTNTDLGDMAANTLKGNPTAASADPSDFAVTTNSAVGRLGGNITNIPMGTTANTLAWGDHTHSQLHNRSHTMTSTSDHTATAWRLFYSDGSGNVSEMTLGTGGQVLKSNGLTAAPTWQTDNNSGGTVTGTGANGRVTFWNGASTITSNGNFLWDDANSRLGIGTSSAASTALNVYEGSGAEATFTQAVDGGGLLVTSNFVAANYTPGLFWNTTGNNPTKPKAGIYLQTNAGGSKMILGTSGSYGTGITNYGLTIDEAGKVGIGTISPAQGIEVYRDDQDVAIRLHDPGNTHYSLGSDFSDGGKFKINYGSFVGENNHITMTTGGLVGIGSNSPAQMLDVAGDINSSVGFRIANGATAGQFLRGNGTRYVASSILASDIPGGSGNYIQNQIASAQSSSNLWVSGSARADGDMRAPIFYDQNNTGYYVDPDAISRVYRIGFNGQNTINSGLYIWSTSDAAQVIYSAAPGADGGARQSGYWDGSHRMRFRTAPGQGFVFENSSNVTVLDIDADNGNLYTPGQVRAPIYYDLDNTGYYSDPAATSNLSTVTANADIYNAGWYRGGTADNGHVRLYGNSRQMVFRTDGSTQYSDNGGYPFVWLYGGDNSGNRRMILANNGDIWTASYGWLHSYFAPISGSGNYINNGTGAQSANFNITGNGTVAGELYVNNWIRKADNDGIYWSNNNWHLYPVNSSDFYLRSGNSSEMAMRLNTNGTDRGYLYVNSSNQLGFLNTNREWHLRSQAGDGYSPNLYFVESGNESWTGDPGNDEGKVEYHSNRLYLASGANSTEVVRFRRSGSDVGIIANDGAAHHPIMYDWNDGSYYTDPNSWSRQYGLGSFYLRNNYDVGTDHPYGMYFSNDLSTAYAIFREGGGWGHPYPDLRIAFHTGIKFGANPSYQGMRFYSDYDMSSLVMAVNDGTTGGGGNVYMTGSLGVGGAPPYRIYGAGDIYADGGWMRVSGGQGLYFQSYGGGWYMVDGTWVRAYNGKSVLAQVNNGGTPAIRGDQASSGWYAGEFNSYNSNTGAGIYSRGYVYAYTYYSYSTKDLKKNIEKFDDEDYESALAFMDDIDLSYYRMKDDEEYPKIHVGMIAEDAPTTLTAPGKKGVAYGELAIYATGAVKALKKEVQTLKGQLNKVSDFGAENIHTKNMWVEFSNDFKDVLNGEDPVVVLTPSQSGTIINLIDVNKNGFEVENPNGQSVTFSWIAMAKVEPKEEENKYSEKFDAALKSAENDTRPIPVKPAEPSPGISDPSAPAEGILKNPEVDMGIDPNLPDPAKVGQPAKQIESKDALKRQ